jgi:hypothetical protein
VKTSYTETDGLSRINTVPKKKINAKIINIVRFVIPYRTPEMLPFFTPKERGVSNSLEYL